MQRLLDPRIIENMIVTNSFDGCYAVRLVDPGEREGRTAIKLRRDDFDGVGVDLANRRAARAHDVSYHQMLGGEGIGSLRDRISRARSECDRMGIRAAELPGTFILLGVVYVRDFWRDELFQTWWRDSPLPPDNRFRIYLANLKSQVAAAGLPFKPWW